MCCAALFIAAVFRFRQVLLLAAAPLQSHWVLMHGLQFVGQATMTALAIGYWPAPERGHKAQSRCAAGGLRPRTFGGHCGD